MEANNEIWKSIEGYEGLYEVSNFGRIKSLPRYVILGNGKMCERLIDEKILEQKTTTKFGYKKVSLNKNKKQKTFVIHRLVASAFIPNPENKPQVNHKDGVKTNNNLENLEWVTASENQIHALKLGLVVPKRGKDHYLYNNPKANPQYGKKGILSPNYGKRGILSPTFGRTGALSIKSKIVIDMQTGIFYESAKEAAKALNYKHSTLKSYLNGRLKNKTNLLYA